MKKLTGILLTFLLIMSMVAGFAAEGAAHEQSAVFFDSATGLHTASLPDSGSVKVKVDFTAPYSGTAKVMAAKYSTPSVLADAEILATVSMTEGEPVSFTSGAISADDAGTVKIYVWGGESTLKPILNVPAVIQKQGEAGAVSKFTNAPAAPEAVIINTPVKLGDIFASAEDLSTIKSANVQVFADADFIYTPDKSDWTNGTLVFSNPGTFALTVTDYSFCVPFVATVTAKEPDPVVKFEAKSDATTTFTNGDTVKLGDIFSTVDGAQITDAGVIVTSESESVTITYVSDSESWANGTVKFNGVGDITLTITDNDYCIPTSIAVTVKEPDPVAKFEVKADADLTYTKGDTVKLGNLFNAVDGAEIDVANVIVTSESEDVTITYISDSADWTNSTVTLNGVGAVTLTITDNNYCIPASVSLNVVYKETSKFAKADAALEIYTLGDVVTLGDLFTAIEGVEPAIDADAIKVTATNATYTANADWTSATVAFDKLGEATVEITDGYYCIPTSIAVTVKEPDPVAKFEVKADADLTYTKGDTVKAGDIFSAIDGAKIDTANVTVTTDSETATVVKADNWAESAVTFNGVGEIKLTVTDNYYCIATEATVTVEYKQTEKFAKADTALEEYTLGDVVTLGDLFTAIEDVEPAIKADAVKVTATNATYTVNADWTLGTVAFDKLGEVTVEITDDFYCIPTSIALTVKEPEPVDKFTVKFPNTGKYLYRVGNTGDVALGSLFGAIEGAEIGNVTATVTSLDSTATASGAFTTNSDWTKSTINFDGTGIVEVTIDDDKYANALSLKLEVVDATNVTQYSELKEETSVLLDNITMSNGGTYRLTGNKTLYGNGFTFDVRNGAHAGVEYDYASYVIYVENSKLDNIVIEGAVYPEVGGTKSDDYHRAIVMTNGKCVISNSYISNGASPIRCGDDLELINTTLKGGVYSNLDLRNGHLILDNVTTINQIGANDKYNNSEEKLGMGIVIYQEGGTEELEITIRNSLNQYNYLSKSQVSEYMASDYASIMKNVLFASDFSAYQNDGWINSGIVSMNTYFTESDLHDERTDAAGYFGTAKTITLLGKSRDCYVYTYKPTTTDAPAGPVYSSEVQGLISPDAIFDFSSKNYIPKTEGSNDYCYGDAGKVYISMDEGDSFDWDTSILSVTKNGKTIPYTVTMNGTDYTNKSITFNTAETYTLTYTYTDSDNYAVSEGNLTTFDKVYEEKLEIVVSVVKAAAKHAEFSFGANGTAYSARVQTIGDKTYVMPDVSATVSGKVGSKTVNGTTVYYPITEMFTSDGKTTHSSSWYACFPIFKDALQIIDYADKGTGDPVTYSHSTVTKVNQIPASLKAVDPKTAFLYSMNATNYPPPTEPSSVSSTVCYTCNKNGLDGGNSRSEESTVAEYTYTDNAGTVYYYFIGYHCAAQTGSGGSCITPETLITLADGSQKEVQYLTGDEMLLVWNLETGKYEEAPIVFIDVDEAKEYEVVTLSFSDGSEVGVIAEHGFFDADLGEYVYITAGNAKDYIGHSFVKQGDVENDSWNIVTLDNVTVETGVTKAYSPVTFGQLCYYTDGILSMPGGIYGLFNIFEVDTQTMSYDAVKMQADIDKYGLFTYADFETLIPQYMYDAFNGDILKVSIGKGMLTWEDIENLAERYAPLC